LNVGKTTTELIFEKGQLPESVLAHCTHNDANAYGLLSGVHIDQQFLLRKPWKVGRGGGLSYSSSTETFLYR
jgi:hypothetical protein